MELPSDNGAGKEKVKQILTNLILSKTAPKCPASKKRKLSETNDDNSDIPPPLKRTKLVDNSIKYYDDMIQLLNDGVISYSNSKKQIRTILEQKYNFQRKYLKRDKDFAKAVDRIVDDLRDNEDDDRNKENDTLQNTDMDKLKKTNQSYQTMRELKAELSSRCGGCAVHALGHIHFKKVTDSLEMHCNLCQPSLIQQISLPQHLRAREMIDIHDTTKSTKSMLIAKDRNKKHLNEWDCNEIIHWMNRVDNGKLNDMKYSCLKTQIKIANIKGYELSNINDTTLKLIGIKDVKNRKLILNYFFDLISNNNDVAQCKK